MSLFGDGASALGLGGLSRYVGWGLYGVIQCGGGLPEQKGLGFGGGDTCEEDVSSCPRFTGLDRDDAEATMTHPDSYLFIII